MIPEDLERIYGAAPEISEIAVLEDRSTLVALVRPDAAKLRQQGATNLRDAVRVILGGQAQHLPSYERLSGFALTDQPLPRTRLGKYRRFMLPMLYAQAADHGEPPLVRALCRLPQTGQARIHPDQLPKVELFPLPTAFAALHRDLRCVSASRKVP